MGRAGLLGLGGKMKLIIPGELPALNEIIELSKRGNRNYQPYNNVKRQHTETVAWIAKSCIKKKLKKIDLNITYYCKNRMKDKDNIMVGVKFILDGLVEGGIIKNDGWSEVGNINSNFEVDKCNPRIEVSIQEVKT